MSYWPEASIGSLPCGPLHRTAHNIAAGFIREAKEDAWQQDGSHSFLKPNLRSDILSFCSILCITSTSLGPAHTQGEDYRRTWRIGGEDHWAISEAAYHTQNDWAVSLGCLALLPLCTLNFWLLPLPFLEEPPLSTPPAASLAPYLWWGRGEFCNWLLKYWEEKLFLDEAANVRCHSSH